MGAHISTPRYRKAPVYTCMNCHVPDHLAHKLLACRLGWGKEPEQSEKSSLGSGVRCQLCSLVHIHHGNGEVSATAALASLHHDLGDIIEDVNGSRPGGVLDKEADYCPCLLVGMVEFVLFEVLLEF